MMWNENGSEYDGVEGLGRTMQLAASMKIGGVLWREVEIIVTESRRGDFINLFQNIIGNFI